MVCNEHIRRDRQTDIQGAAENYSYFTVKTALCALHTNILTFNFFTMRLKICYWRLKHGRSSAALFTFRFHKYGLILRVSVYLF